MKYSKFCTEFKIDKTVEWGFNKNKNVWEITYTYNYKTDRVDSKIKLSELISEHWRF